MAKPTPYPAAEDESAQSRQPKGGLSRWLPILVIAVFVIAVLLMIALHLTGTLGPGAH